MLKTLSLAAMLAAVLVASPVTAATVNYATGSLAPGAQQTPSPLGPVVDVNVSGSSPNVYRDLWEGTGCANSCLFNSVRGGGSATYDFGADRSFLAMMWGSPDANKESGIRNLLQFYLDDNPIPVFSLDGSTVGAGAGFFGSGFITILVSALTYDRIVLTASQNAFEHAFSASKLEIPPEVPLPAGIWLLLSGLLGLGFLGRSKAKAG